jgi:nitric oxide reductase NorD protein
VPLASVQRAAGLLFHAAGGAPGVRIVPAGLARVGGPRTWLQGLAGSGTRAAVARLDADTLALPPVVAVFEDTALNRDLYLWLAALAAFHAPGPDWIAGNLAATQRALAHCPGLAPRWQRLRAAHLAQRPAVHTLRGEAALAEAAVQAALQGAAQWVRSRQTAMKLVAPVWLWLQAVPMAPAAAARAAAGGTLRPRRPQSPAPPAPPAAARARPMHARAAHRCCCLRAPNRC